MRVLSASKTVNRFRPDNSFTQRKIGGMPILQPGKAISSLF
jgi:hypothetical protein